MKVEKGALRPTLEKAVQKHGGKCAVVLDGAGEVPMEMLYAVQTEMEDLGLMKIVYAGTLDHKLPMMLPPDQARAKLAKLPPKRVAHLKVDGEGRVFLGGKQIKPKLLSATVKKMLTREPDLVFVLHTQPQTRYTAFTETLDALQQGGAKKIAMADPEA